MNTHKVADRVTLLFMPIGQGDYCPKCTQYIQKAFLLKNYHYLIHEYDMCIFETDGKGEE